MAWLDKAHEIVARGQSCVLVTVAQTRGSAPRDAGAKMLIWADGTLGTIGGGQLEFNSVTTARAMLRDVEAPAAHIEEFALGPRLAQCCGGSATLLFERVTPNSLFWLETWAAFERANLDCVIVTSIGTNTGSKTFGGADSPLWNRMPIQVANRVPKLLADRVRCVLVELRDKKESYVLEYIGPFAEELYLFGAGHVGKAVARALAPLPFRITWIDSRSDFFPSDLAPSVTRCISASPPNEVARAPAGALFLVMSHSHPLDLEICAHVLRRGDFGFLGLIGSETKRARFASRLRTIGIPPHMLGRLTCPIGIPGIGSKEPAAIAAAVAAQLLLVAERQAERKPPMAALNVGT
jgi:xanthine dehydrogenase accessory factor